MKRWTSMAVVAMGWLLATAPAARADSRSDKARAHFEKGTSFYNLAHFKDALGEFESGYLEKADPVFIYNIAQCHRQMGNIGEALRFYRTYLRSAPKAPNRVEVERRIKDLEAASATETKL